MARFYTTSKGEFLKPFDPSDYGYAGTAKTTGSGTRSTAAPKLGDFEVLPQDVNALDSRMTDYQKRINDLTYQAQQDPKSIKALTPEMQKLSLEIGSDVRAGDIYHMLNRKSEYDRTVDTLKKVFKDRPDLLDAAIGAIEIPPLIDENGEYQQIRAPRVTDPWTSAREGKLFKDVLSSMKPTLQDSKDWQSVPAVSDEITKFFERSNTYGLNAADIETAILSQLSPQDRLAIRQEAELMGYDPDEVEKFFLKRVKSFSQAISGTTRTERNTTKSTDEQKRAELIAIGKAKGSGDGPDAKKDASWFADRLSTLYVDMNKYELKDLSEYLPDNVTQEEFDLLLPIHTEILANPNKPLSEYNLTPREKEILEGLKLASVELSKDTANTISNALKDKPFINNKEKIVLDITFDPLAAEEEQVMLRYSRPKNPGETKSAGESTTVTVEEPLTLELLERVLGTTEMNKVYNILKNRNMINEDTNTINWRGNAQTQSSVTTANPDTTQEAETDIILPDNVFLRFDRNKSTDNNKNGAYLVYTTPNQNLKDLGYQADLMINEETGLKEYRYYMPEEVIEQLKNKYGNDINPLDANINAKEVLKTKIENKIKTAAQNVEIYQSNKNNLEKIISEIKDDNIYEDLNNGNKYKGAEYRKIRQKELAEVERQLTEAKKEKEEAEKLDPGMVDKEIGEGAVEEAKEEYIKKILPEAKYPADTFVTTTIIKREDDFTSEYANNDMTPEEIEASGVTEEDLKKFKNLKRIKGYRFVGPIDKTDIEATMKRLGQTWDNMRSNTGSYKFEEDGSGGYYLYEKIGTNANIYQQ